MKILHTSDWHLGQYFMMKTREAEHFAFLNWLITIVIEEGIDALIVAGDVFDSTLLSLKYIIHRLHWAGDNP